MKHRHIGLVIGTEGEHARRVLRGVSRFARESGRPWLFYLTPHYQPNLKGLAAWKPAGVLTLVENPRLVEEVLALGKPAVNVAYWLDDPRLPLVGNDNAAIGRAVAEHFLERNFHHFAYVGWPAYLFSDQREAGFRSAVAEAGYDCVCYPGRPHRPRWRLTDSVADHERLRRWLARLAIPSAIMASNDIRAWQVLQACQELERHVPEEIAVVGVDNDEAWCLLSQPSLSSVAVAAEQIGYLAAAKLARLLAGRRVEHQTVVPPLGVIARRS